ncbi:GGDEF domain-containing protein [Vogesella indigofera]|uniref:GGDEF domain-containing protein n=1 Tax=Vogesella indigofera TaxID=45465 RepID=UPI00234EE77E|nr:diguanylate cyclase [Vogesella indigofera]MDC7711459.1 diguanylate cyclase [Vogesella indigofera]
MVTAAYRPLAHVLIRRIMLLATACALLLSAVQGVLTYRQVQQRFEATLQDIVSSNLPMLSVGIWDIEAEAVRRQVETIVAKPEIGYARLNVATGQVFEAGDAGLLRQQPGRRFDIPPPRGRGEALGTLLIAVQPALLYQALTQALLAVFLGYLLLTLLICSLVAYVLRREVERPLRGMAEFAGRLAPSSLTVPLQLSRPARPHHDEIDLVARGFATLQAAISRHIDTLDQQVEERTRQLDAALSDIRELSIRDGLTGCYNRALLSERLPSELERAQRYQRPLAVVFCDADHFKPVNDRFGHLAGDEVLRAIALRISSQLRQDIDWVVRFGGEEFVIVLPETDLAAALVTAERLRAAISTSVILADGRTVQITASLGVAAFQSGEDVESLLNRADTQLYLAKQGGRNRVMG